MKILIDLSFIKDGNTSIGFTRVSLNLLSGFIDLGMMEDIIILSDCSSSEFFRTGYKGLKVITSKYTNNLYDKFFPFRKRNELRKIIKTQTIDLLFCPFISFNTITVHSCKSVGILHDVQKIKIMDQRKGIVSKLYKCWMGKVITGFSHIVTISDSEKTHILSIYPLISQRLSVIHNGIEIVHDSTPVRELEGVPGYILDVNTLYKYKNPLVLIKAFQKIMDKIPHLLVFKGKPTPYWDKEIVPYISEHNLDKRVLLISRILSDEEMSYLYRNASVFVSPSRMEGFGLTPVEAAINGTPVICSNIDTLKETTLGLTDYFDPDDSDRLSELIMKYVSTSKLDYKSISERLSNEYSVRNQVIRYKNLFESL